MEVRIQRPARLLPAQQPGSAQRRLSATAPTSSTMSPTRSDPLTETETYTAKMYQIGGFAQTDWRVRAESHVEPRPSLRFVHAPGARSEARRLRKPASTIRTDCWTRISTSDRSVRATIRSNPTNGSISGRASDSPTTSGARAKLSCAAVSAFSLADRCAGALWAHVQPTPTAPFRFNFIRADTTRLGIKVADLQRRPDPSHRIGNSGPRLDQHVLGY